MSDDRKHRHTNSALRWFDATLGKLTINQLAEMLYKNKSTVEEWAERKPSNLADKIQRMRDPGPDRERITWR